MNLKLVLAWTVAALPIIALTLLIAHMGGLAIAAYVFGSALMVISALIAGGWLTGYYHNKNYPPNPPKARPD